MGEEIEIWKINKCARQAADGTGAANLKRALGVRSGPPRVQSSSRQNLIASRELVVLFHPYADGLLRPSRETSEWRF